MSAKVLVPLDGSTASESILVQVRRLVRGTDAEVVLLHVVEENPGEDGRAYLRATMRARERLRRLAVSLREDGIRAEGEVRSGDPAGGILRFAAEIEPALVAMSTHGRTGLARLIRGSVAERVLRHSTHPLLLARPTGLESEPVLPGPFRRILVPLDGSERSAQILPRVQELARACGSEVVLQHASLDAPWATGDAPPAPADLSVDEALLRPWRERLERAGIRCRVRIDRRLPPQAILDAAAEEGADLIALATHGRSGASRWFFGSVAEGVLGASTTPTFVLRTASPAGLEVEGEAFEASGPSRLGSGVPGGPSGGAGKA